MTTATAHPKIVEIAAQWRNARRLYAVYGAIFREHHLGTLCPELESPIDRNDREAIARVHQWITAADERVEAWQIRQLIQTTHLGTEENVRVLASHYLALDDRRAHRDKIDFLLVQYFTQRAPLAVHDCQDFDLEIVADVLEPVIGESVPNEPRCASPLHRELEAMSACRTLGELLAAKVLEHGREVKEAAGDMFFGTAALLAFTRFNFLVRRAFFRLMQADLAALRANLRELEAKGVALVDCTAAGLDAGEPVAGLRRFCNNWHVPFRAPYDCGRPLLPLAEIRKAAEQALANVVTVPQPLVVAAATTVTEAPAEAAATPAQAEPASGAEGAASAEFQVLPLHAPEEHPAHIAVPRIEPEPFAHPAAEPGPAVPVNDSLASMRDIAQPASHPLHEGETEQGSPEVAAPSIPSLEACLEEIAPQLLDGVHSATATRITCGGSRMLIASWEAAAFVRGGDETSDALQRAVAARSLLLQAVERRKNEDASWLEPALNVALAEIAQMQAQITRAKETQDIDAAVNLAATATRLSSLVQEAAKLVAQAQQGG